MKPDAAKLASLSAVIAHDMDTIERLQVQLKELAVALGTPRPMFRDLAAVAYLLHNLYNTLENSFEQISRTFENHVTAPVQWHKELLGKMFLEIPTIRPAVLPEDLRSFLSDLRGFRHLFRHAYDFDLDAQRLNRLVRDWTTHQPKLKAALETLCAYLLDEARKGPAEPS